jgi:hypothetical protein
MQGYERFSEDDYLAWKELYESGRTLLDIAKFYRVRSRYVALQLHRLGVEIRSTKITKQVISDPFAVMTDDLAWVLGLLYTDGSVYAREVTLMSYDEDVIQKAHAILQPYLHHRVRIGRAKKGWRIRIASVDMVE